jgi:hypothetical protein
MAWYLIKYKDGFHLFTRNRVIEKTRVRSCIFVLVYVFRYVCTYVYKDRLCGLVVRVSGYRYRGPGLDSRHYQIF